MKSKTNLLIMLLLIFGVTQLSAVEDHIPIPITEEQDDLPIIRAPFSVFISSEYDTEIASFIFTITGNMDTIIVSIKNYGTGETYESALNGSGLFYTPVSGNPGLWRITITLPCGVQYNGTLILD